MALSGDELFLARVLGNMLLGGAANAAPVGRVIAPLNARAQDRVGKAAREGGRNWNTMTREPTGESDMRNLNLQAAQKLADKMRSDPIDFDAGIIYVPGHAQENSMLVRTPDNLKAFLRQSEEQHAEALNRYMNDERIPKDRAAQLGIKAEEQLPEWWNDHDPRLPVTPSSSCVKRARIGADGDIYVVFGSNPNTEYQYEGSSDPVEASRILQELVTAPSIGRAINSWTGTWGKSHTYLPKA